MDFASDATGHPVTSFDRNFPVELRLHGAVGQIVEDKDHVIGGVRQNISEDSGTGISLLYRHGLGIQFRIICVEEILRAGFAL